MSASTEKKIRAKAKEEGTDKKTNKAAEEAKKNAKTRKKYTISVVAALVLIVIILFLNSGLYYRSVTALKVGNDRYSTAEVNYEYAGQYYSFINNYGSYAAYFGLDTSYGLSTLGSQTCYLDENGGTWRDYFKTEALNTLKQISALCAYAEQNGITLDAEDYADIDAMFEDIEVSAAAYGYKSAKQYLEAVYGRGVNEDVITAVEARRSLAFKAYEAMLDKAGEADTEFVDYDMVNVRHILIKAEADEDGSYSDDARAAAKEKAEAILAEYEAGDKTEESFAALAETYSDDGGSNTNGGLYEDVYKDEMVAEFNDWCFDPSRKAGDTGLIFVDNEDYYVGYHIMYFSGLGDKYSTSESRKNDLATVIADEVEEIGNSVAVETTLFYNLVGKN